MGNWEKKTVLIKRKMFPISTGIQFKDNNKSLLGKIPFKAYSLIIISLSSTISSLVGEDGS